jgi:GrpB-like predicted nucleotidyltransferase (UPF0157 family)/GNAT superfamily N-acetyltransferase
VGGEDAPLEIVDYDPAWPAAFAAEVKRLDQIANDVQWHHIGSTAVPGLAAKPIIDMMAVVDDPDDMARTLADRAAYELPKAYNATLRRRRWLCRPSAARRTHHVHLVADEEVLTRHLQFRDALRDSPKLATEYSALKRTLAARMAEDREGYTEAKTSFVERVLGQQLLASVKFRAAGTSDAGLLARAVVEGFEGYRSFAPPDWEPPSLSTEAKLLNELLADDRVWCRIAELDGQLVGHATFLPASIAYHPVGDPKLAHLRNLFIRSDHWGSGLAFTLHAEALDEARHRGFTRMRLFVPEDQVRGRRFYERAGWTQAGDAFYDCGPGLMVIEYRRPLSPRNVTCRPIGAGWPTNRA